MLARAVIMKPKVNPSHKRIPTTRHSKVSRRCGARNKIIKQEAASPCEIRCTRAGALASAYDTELAIVNAVMLMRCNAGKAG